MTALYTILTILELVFTVKGLPPITCPSDSDCTINCDTFDPINGCAARTIDASYSLSLNVLCLSSQNPFTGGCQYADLICPTSSNSSNSSCNIQCRDYYGCYYTTVHSDMTDEVTLECSEETGSCLHTILYANYSNNVNLSCASNSCDQLQIYAENVMNGVHLSCDGEYACSDIDLYVNTAHNVDVFARGSYALFSSYIYADDADHLHLLCAGKQSEYACYKTFIFPPKHESSGSPGSYIAIPRAQIECQGHGCKDELYFYSKDGALDLDISLNSCTECDDASDCIDNWYFYCDYLTFDTFTGDSCDSDDCNCESATVPSIAVLSTEQTPSDASTMTSRFLSDLTTSPDSNADVTLVMILSPVVIVVLLICLCGSIAFLQKKRVKTNVDFIASDPVNDNSNRCTPVNVQQTKSKASMPLEGVGMTIEGKGTSANQVQPELLVTKCYDVVIAKVDAQTDRSDSDSERLYGGGQTNDGGCQTRTKGQTRSQTRTKGQVQTTEANENVLEEIDGEGQHNVDMRYIQEGPTDIVQNSTSFH